MVLFYAESEAFKIRNQENNVWAKLREKRG